MVKGRSQSAAKFPTSLTERGVTVIAPRGRLDLAVASDLRQQLLELVNGGQSRVVVDLSAVDLIDSSGLGALVSGFEAARERGGDLKITAPGEQAVLVLELTNLNRVLRTVESADSAFDDA